MKRLSRVVADLPQSGIREVMALAATMQDVIHLEVGEPSFNTPDPIIEAAFADAKAGYTKYTANAGYLSLRQAIAERYTAQWQRAVTADQVMVTTGAVAALAEAVFVLVEEGDEVLIPDPGWPNYRSMVMLSRAHPVPYILRPEHGYLPDPREIASRITPRTKALLLNNPSNPAGAVFPSGLVEALMHLAAEYDLYVISDEVYEALVFDGAHTPVARYDNDGRAITVSACSKTYAMTGWRLGYALADPSLVTQFVKLQEPLVSCTSAVSQRAAEAALRGPQDQVEQMRRAYQRRRDLVCETLGPSGLLPTIPRGAFYALLDLRRLGISSRALARAILEEERVATVPGDTFGAVSEGMVRISLATADEALVEGCQRIRAFAERHCPSEQQIGVPERLPRGKQSYDPLDG